MTDSAAASYANLGGLIDRLHMTITHVSAHSAVATMPVEGNTQPYGMLHGGASAALVETVASLAAGAHAGPGRIAVGVDLSITHHRAVSSGFVRAEATPLHLGKTVATYDIAVLNEDHERVATARLTCHLRDRVTTSPKYDVRGEPQSFRGV
jgi:1,4-dihydroxy-2-naphthoyl-CoA hydrolase